MAISETIISDIFPILETSDYEFIKAKVKIIIINSDSIQETKNKFLYDLDKINSKVALYKYLYNFVLAGTRAKVIK